MKTKSIAILRDGWLLPLVVAAVLSSHFYFQARVRPLWSDEILTYNLSTADWHEFIRSFAIHEANPPLYFILNRLIISLLGTSEPALRLQSLFWSLAFIFVLWKLGTRFFTVYSSFLGLVLVTLTCNGFMYYVTEARPYTLLGFSTALTLLITSKYALQTPNKRQLAEIFATFALLAYSHTFGAVYGSLILSGVALTSVIGRRPWIAHAVTSMLGVATIILWVPYMLSTASSVSSWIPVPSLGTAYRVIGMGIDYQPYLFLLASVGVVAGLNARSGRLLLLQYSNLSSFQVTLIAAVACLLIIPIIFVQSYYLRPLFWPRYFLGLLASYFLLFSMLSNYCLHACQFSSLAQSVRLIMLSAFFVLSSWPVVHNMVRSSHVPSASQYHSNNPADFIKQPLVDPTSLRGTPVVFADIHLFQQMQHYSRLSAAQTSFLYVEGIHDVLTEDDLKDIARKVRYRFGDQSAQRILILVAPYTSLQSTKSDNFQVVRVGSVTMPHYQSDIANAYLLTINGLPKQ